jgi:hypothetical protein
MQDERFFAPASDGIRERTSRAGKRIAREMQGALDEVGDATDRARG